VSLHALVNVLFGQGSSAGRLPVTVRKPPPSRSLLCPFGFGLAPPRL